MADGDSKITIFVSWNQKFLDYEIETAQVTKTH